MKNLEQLLKEADNTFKDILKSNKIGFVCPECNTQIDFELETGKTASVKCQSCLTEYNVYRGEKGIVVSKRLEK